MAVRSVSIVPAFASLTILLAACATHTEGAVAGAADGPNHLRPAAAWNSGHPQPVEKSSAPAAPRLEIAALHQEPLPSSEAPPVESTPTPVSAPAAACGENMVLVDGEYCTEVKQTCAEWIENPNTSSVARCKRFNPSECVGEKVHKRFCIDKDEYAKKGESLPLGNVSWSDAKKTCEADGKRLCLESEWNFACEGEAMLPYATGLERDSTKCNYDQKKLLDQNGKVLDLRMSVAETEQCVSAFGVRNMNGNIDEWTLRDVTNGEWRSAMKGGWWMAARDRCRPATTAHDEHFKEFQSGFRCCADPR